MRAVLLRLSGEEGGQAADMNEWGDRVLQAVSLEDAVERIGEAKKQLEGKVLILGHHYQRDEVIRFADFTGDSFKLARDAANEADKPYIVFCGVHFMAESADILTSDEQAVSLPDMRAGCSMADMADVDQVMDCWDEIDSRGGGKVVPVTYMNSTAAIKAFCGDRDGIVCTSSNAMSVYRWAFERGERILFIPDEHLGRNTAHRFGIGDDEMALWDPNLPLGGLDGAVLDRARIILWKGHCSVHMHFLPEHADVMRKRFPGIRVIVHPECTAEVVSKADMVGSTEQIIRAVREGGPGSRWAVGTEHHLVGRLAAQNPDREVMSLSPFACQCATMFRISPRHLLHVLEGLLEGRVVNRITVPPEIARPARVALDRMLAHA
ncbi:MAG: quinolinate synthase NadA [Candidatus Eisenbacteria bacterium]